MDYIYITKEDNTTEKMEVVTIFNISNSDYNYIIYKSINNTDYYVGKYVGNDICNLETDLTDIEMNYANGVFEALVGE